MIYRSQVESSLWNSESASMLSALNLQKKDGGVSKVRICKAGCWAAFQNSNSLIGVLLPNSSHDTCIVTHFTVAKEFLAMTRDSSQRIVAPKEQDSKYLPSQRDKYLFPHQELFAQVQISKHLLHTPVAVKEASCTLNLHFATWLFKAYEKLLALYRMQKCKRQFHPHSDPAEVNFWGSSVNWYCYHIIVHRTQ